MEVMTFNIDKDRRNLIDDKQNFNIDFHDSKYNWLKARQYEESMRQVEVHVVHGDGSPVDLTGVNPVFEGWLPESVYRIVDAKHSVMIDAQNGIFRFDFPAPAFQIAGSYKQAFFRLMKDGKSVTTLEFSLDVMADKVISGLVPSDYITPFEDLYNQLKEYLTNANGNFDTAMTQWKKDVADLITNLNADVGGINLTITEIKTQLSSLEDKIKADNIPTQADLDKITDYVNGAISRADSDALIHHVDYATISTTVTPDTMPSSGYEFKHIAKQGANATLVVMVNLASATDPEPVMLDDKLVNTAISNAKDAGVKIKMLKPHLGVDWSDGFDRAHYNPSDKDLFFSNWTKVLVHYADVCVANEIPLLCIQCEQNLLTVNNNLSYWKKLTDAIRKDHPDLLLTTATNSIFFDDNQTAIFDTVDLIGVNVYPNFTYKLDDGSLTIDDIQGTYYDNVMHMNYMERIDSLAFKFQKKVFITEAGIMPQDDGLVHLQSDHPEGQPRNYHVQALGMQLFFEELLTNKNICGFAWWHTNQPFDYFNDEVTTEAEQTMIDYVKKVK